MSFELIARAALHIYFDNIVFFSKFFVKVGKDFLKKYRK